MPCTGFCRQLAGWLPHRVPREAAHREVDDLTHGALLAFLQHAGRAPSSVLMWSQCAGCAKMGGANACGHCRWGRGRGAKKIGLTLLLLRFSVTARVARPRSVFCKIEGLKSPSFANPATGNGATQTLEEAAIDTATQREAAGSLAVSRAAHQQHLLT